MPSCYMVRLVGFLAIVLAVINVAELSYGQTLETGEIAPDESSSPPTFESPAIPEDPALQAIPPSMPKPETPGERPPKFWHRLLWWRAENHPEPTPPLTDRELQLREDLWAKLESRGVNVEKLTEILNDPSRRGEEFRSKLLNRGIVVSTLRHELNRQRQIRHAIAKGRFHEQRPHENGEAPDVETPLAQVPGHARKNGKVFKQSVGFDGIEPPGNRGRRVRAELQDKQMLSVQRLQEIQRRGADAGRIHRAIEDGRFSRHEKSIQGKGQAKAKAHRQSMLRGRGHRK